MAEYYGIYDWKSYPPAFIGTLAMGLRADSRTMMKLMGADYDATTKLLGIQADALNMLLWTKSKDAQRNRKRPPSVFPSKKDPENDIEGLDSPEEFDAWLKKTREK